MNIRIVSVYFSLFFSFFVQLKNADAFQLDNPSQDQMLQIFNFLSGVPVDFDQMARNSEAFRRADEFSRASVLQSEIGRLQAEFSRWSNLTNATILVRGRFSDYDSAKNGFPLDVFQPGISIPFGRTSLIFDNRQEFETWSLDVTAARQMISQTNNNRSVVFEVNFRPFGVSTAHPPGVRAQVSLVRIRDERGRAVLAEIRSQLPARAMQAPGMQTVAPVPTERLSIMELSLGANNQTFEAWAQRNNILIQRRLSTQRLSRQGGWRSLTFASNQDAINALDAEGRRTPEERAHSGLSAAAALRAAANPGFDPPIDVLGPALDCLTRLGTQQVCGQVQFITPSEDINAATLARIILMQTLTSDNTDDILKAVVQRYGNFVDQFDARWGNIVGRQYVWGPSFAKRTDNLYMTSIGQQRSNWPLEAYVFKISANRVALIIVVGGNHGAPAASSGAAEAGRPRL